jgi:hypothetical protein
MKRHLISIKNRSHDTCIMDKLTSVDNFTWKELQDINRCQLDQRAHRLSNGPGQGRYLCTDHPHGHGQCNTGQQHGNRGKCTGASGTRMACFTALGPWIKGHHQTQEWCYDSVYQLLYQHTEGSGTAHWASNLDRLRFHAKATTYNAPGEVARVT